MIKVNTAEFSEIQNRLKLKNHQLAAKIDVTPNQLWRILAGRSGAGSEFIEKTLTAFPEYSFADLFFINNTTTLIGSQHKRQVK
jgi:predicted component of type VI protein secretion system